MLKWPMTEMESIAGKIALGRVQFLLVIFGLFIRHPVRQV